MTMELQQLGRIFQALSDETRLRIVRMLADGEHCVCDLQEAVDSYQSRLSFHLKRLKDAGLVSDRKEGRWVYYTLRREVLADVAEFFSTIESGAAEAVNGSGCCR